MADAYGASRGELLAPVFWERLGGGEFLVQRCGQCRQVRFPPGKFCPRCQAVEWSWLAVCGAGTLWSYTTVRVAPRPELADQVPYHVGVVELAEGPLVLGRLHDVVDQPEIGMPLTLVIDPPAAGDQPARYHFHPA